MNGRTDERTDGWTDRRGSRNSYLDSGQNNIPNITPQMPDVDNMDEWLEHIYFYQEIILKSFFPKNPFRWLENADSVSSSTFH